MLRHICLYTYMYKYVYIYIYINLMLLSTLWLFDINWKPLWAFDKLVAPIQSFGVERETKITTNLTATKWQQNKNNNNTNNNITNTRTTGDSRKRTRRWIVLTCFFLVSSTLSPSTFLALSHHLYGALFPSRCRHLSRAVAFAVVVVGAAAGRLRRWTGLFLYQNVQTLLHLLILIIIKWEARNKKTLTTSEKLNLINSTTCECPLIEFRWIFVTFSASVS